MPVVVRHAENCSAFTARKYQAIFEVLAASVHVRMQTGEFYVRGNFKAGVDAIIRMAGRNLEGPVGSRKREDAGARRLLGENDAEAGLIAHSVSVRRVVDLKNDVGAGFDELGLAGTKDFGGLAGRVANQEIAGKRAGVRLFFGLDLRGGEEDAGLLSTEPVGARFANVGNDVVDNAASGRADLSGLNPLIFGETGGHDYVLV